MRGSTLPWVGERNENSEARWPQLLGYLLSRRPGGIHISSTEGRRTLSTSRSLINRLRRIDGIARRGGLIATDARRWP